MKKRRENQPNSPIWPMRLLHKKYGNSNSQALHQKNLQLMTNITQR